MRRALWTQWALFAALAAGCSDPTSATDLHTAGPPMIEQIRMTETFTVQGTNGPTGESQVVFGFGTYPTAPAALVHTVTSAQAETNQFRIIMDHLLVGNNLEEIECRMQIDANGAFSRVPLGDTPDDIAHCAAPQDVLPQLCPGSSKRSVCICQLDGGCMAQLVDGTVITADKGQSVGVLDMDQDGAADDNQFIQGAVALSCGSHTIGANLPLSYWTPSGDQLVPAHGGFDALGPAIVFVPAGPLPTNVACGITFSPDVVDKAGVKVCAPPGGDIDTGCTPGDTSAVAFTVEPLTLIHEGQTAVGAKLMGSEGFIANTLLDLTIPLDPTQPNSVVTITENGAPFTAFTAKAETLTNGLVSDITLTWNPPGLMPNTPYVITFSTGVVDSFGEPLPQPVSFAFTSGPGPN